MAIRDIPILNIVSDNIGLSTTESLSFRIQPSGSIGPNNDNVYDLGSSAKRWRKLYATNAYLTGSITSASYAFSASYAPFVQTWQASVVSASYASSSLSSSYSLSASYVSGASSASASYALSASYAPFVHPWQASVVSASYASSSLSASYAPSTQTWQASVVSASYASSSLSSSYILLAKSASYAPFTQTWQANVVSASYASSSLSASYAPGGSSIVNGGSYNISASYASSSLSASYAPGGSGVTSGGSYNISASYASSSLSASYAPFTQTWQASVVSASYASSSLSSSYAPFTQTWQANVASASYASSSLSSSYTPNYIGRSVVLCTGYTPISVGADSAEVVIPYSPKDGTTQLTYTIKRFNFRAATIGSGSSNIVFEKSSGTGPFSAVPVGDITLNSGSYETFTGSLSTINSGDKIRFNINILGDFIGWTVIAEISTLQ